MSIIDITRTIHPEMAIYPNNPGVEFEQTQKAGGGKNSLTRIALGTHTGTHIDTPAHIHEGAEGALTYPLDRLIGPAQVVDMTHVDDVITAEDLGGVTLEHPNIILKTSNSTQNVDEFQDNFIAIDESAAELLVKHSTNLIGLDALSIKKRGVRDRVHEILIDSGMVVLEGLWLAHVEPGKYELLCLPLKVDLDGTPVRAVLHR